MSSSSSKIRPSLRLHSSSSISSPSKSTFIWRFPPAKFDTLPSCTSKRLSTFDLQPLNIDNELIQRQELALFIYELGSHLNVSFSCVYTAVVYMHRFFMLHPFQQCVKESVATACLFLACKINEMPRPLNDFTRQLCQHLNRIPHNSKDPLSSSSSTVANSTPEILSNYNQQIIDYENMLLSTLGFCLNVDQPYMTITRISQRLSIPMEIIQKAYEIATKSIFFTLFTMKYTNNLIACFALYLAIRSSQINIPDNEDGSQWFHLLNEEFTEKLLREIADEYQVICVEKCPKNIQERHEQIRQQKKANGQPSKSNCERSDSTTSLHDTEQHHYPTATTSGSVRSTTSSSSIQQPQSNIYEHEIHHHTPNRSTLINLPSGEFSPSTGTLVHSPTTTFQTTSSPKQNQNHFNGPYHSNNSSVSSAKPIPTLMSSSTTNSYHHSLGPRHHVRYSAPIFKYPLSSPTQHVFRPPPLHPPHFHQQYPSNYLATSSYYPQQQAPLFYHSPQDPSNLTNKRYGEPPAPPMKRFRYSLNPPPPQQHY